MKLHLFYDYLLGIGVPKDHIITIALDDDLNVAYRDPAELSKYIRSKVADQEGMFYIFIDEVQCAYRSRMLQGEKYDWGCFKGSAFIVVPPCSVVSLNLLAFV